VPAIQHLAPTLPNLAGCLKAFMTGAADTWKRFGEEYHQDGVIARLSASARAKIYINPTNDHNEGALGRLRRAVREVARLSLSAHNTKSKYTINDTRDFLRSPTVTDVFRRWLRGEAHRRIDSGRDRKRRLELIHRARENDGGGEAGRGGQTKSPRGGDPGRVAKPQAPPGRRRNRS
ncbi:hypothetical protein K438DRAFT_1617450, partial [Mycena galopus ATCC 62051]